ncbi:hypothetical protein ACKFKF_27405 [Phormidesmis sp. 146-12]
MLAYRIGGGSLYRHKDLWHPNYLRIEEFELDNSSDKNGFPNNHKTDPSLFPGNGGNEISHGSSSDSKESVQNPVAEYRAVEQSDFLNEVEALSQPFAISAQDQQAINQEALSLAQEQRHLCSPQQLARMQYFLASGDPILVAEAMAWFYIQSQKIDSSKLRQSDFDDV